MYFLPMIQGWVHFMAGIKGIYLTRASDFVV